MKADGARERGAAPATPAPDSVDAPPGATTRLPAAAALALDAALLLLFAGIGRRSHGEALLVGLWHTAWPFLTGAAVGWLLVLGLRRRAAIAPRDGVPVWISTVAGGMILRACTGAGVAVSFVVVASVVTALFLLGWRLVAAVSAARRARRAA